MYSPTRSRLGPKPTSAAPRSPSSPTAGARSPSVPSASKSGINTTSYMSPYRARTTSSNSSNAHGSGAGGVLSSSAAAMRPSALSASALAEGAPNASTGKATGSPTSPARGVGAGTSPNSAASGSRIQTVPQGGAVGLWRVARDGHSPLANEGDANGANRSAAQRPATQGNPFTSRLGINGGNGSGSNTNSPQRSSAGPQQARGGTATNLTSVMGGPSTPSSSNVTSAPLLNMSLDAALMGGLMREINSAANKATPPTNARTGIMGRKAGASPSPPGSPTAAAGGGSPMTSYRSQSANATAPHSPSAMHHQQQPIHHNPNYLIPSLQLPVYRRAPTAPHDVLPDGAFTVPSPANSPHGASGADATDTNATSGAVKYIDARPSFVTVVFDLDETLCNNRLPGKAMLRNGCMELLHALVAIRDDPSKNCFVEIILWTASMECVARPVLDRMDPFHTVFNHLIFRDRRWYKENGYTKDLRLLGRDLSHVVIIENSPMSVVLNRKHAILTKDFVGGGSVNYYYGGGPLNTRTSTGSPTDPSLFVVKKVLCDWATAVGQQSLSTLAQASASGATNRDPSFIAIPMPFGIVEFLRDSPDISTSNEVVLPTNGGAAAGGRLSMSGSSLCGSPARGIRGAGGVAPSPKRNTTAGASSPGGWGTAASYRSMSAASPVRRYS